MATNEGNIIFTVLAAFIKHPQYCVSKSVQAINYQKLIYLSTFVITANIVR